MEQTGMDIHQMLNALNKQSGLKGLCGVNDMREVVERTAKGNEQAETALQIFCCRIQKYIGAYMAVVKNLDAIAVSYTHLDVYKRQRYEELRSFIHSHENKDGIAMTALQEAQSLFGYLPLEVHKFISKETGVSIAELYGVTTFYSQFNTCLLYTSRCV